MSRAYRVCEDAEECPEWLTYCKSYTIYNTEQKSQFRREIQEFEQSHPRLTLTHVEEHKSEKKVFGDILFQDGEHQYRELLFSYPVYLYILYYMPEDDLREFLTLLQEFIEARRQRRYSRNKRRNIALSGLLLYLALYTRKLMKLRA